jgi:hypothetical protein
MGRFSATAGAGAALIAVSSMAAQATPQTDHGKYLVSVVGCTDCHTAGSFTGKPDTAHFLGGSDVGFSIPGLGVFVPPNLTPDKETGLGNWTTQQIMTAFQTGVRPDGRQLAPAMPYMDFVNLTKEDATDIALYLQSLPPVKNKVPGPFGPADKPTSLVYVIVPGAVYAAMPQPGAPPSAK